MSDLSTLRRHAHSFLLLACLALCIVGCADNKTSSRDLKLVDVNDASAAVQKSSGVLGIAKSNGVFLDPRTDEDYNAAHIPGALNLPFSRLVVEHQRLLKDYDTFVVYGSDYSDPLPEAMSKRLIELGYKNVLTLRGGLRAWKQAGNPVEPADKN